MFDVSATELLVCLIVALIVLGPEKLPAVARTVGRWTGQAKSYLRNLSAELDRESQAAELKKQLLEAQQTLKEQTDSIKDATTKFVSDVKDNTKP